MRARALREALANAVIHGNGENSYKRVYVDCRCYLDGEVSITVRDEGPGFNSEEVANPTTQKTCCSRMVVESIS